MAKKKNKNTPKKSTTNPKNTAPEPKKKSRYPLFALLAGAVLVLAGAYYLYQGQKQPARTLQLTEVKSENINLRLNYRQMGLGGDNSWGARPHPEFTIKPDQAYHHAFRLSPITAAKAMKSSKRVFQ